MGNFHSSRFCQTCTFAVALFALGFVVAAQGGEMKLLSSSFRNGGALPSKCGRQGGNVSPALQIENVPVQPKSLVLVVQDMDAPGGLFTHWLVWNIDPKTRAIVEGRVPPGAIEGTNDFGDRGYGGPQPPSGTHRYVFKTFALDRRLNVAAGAKKPALEQAMSGHVLGQAQLLGRFSVK